MDWKALPSLAALRAFEATARHTTYAAAARELNVTDAALRQHVRALEAEFGCDLVRRAGRGVALTDDGKELARSLAAGFGTIAEGVAAMARRGIDRPVRVACTPAFAETWLMPRLAEFWIRYPDIKVELAPSLKNADLESGTYDIAIRYGRGDWDWPNTHLLASAAYTIVAEPRYASSVKGDISAGTWLFETGRKEHERWAENRGIRFFGDNRRHYPTNSLVLSAARAGHGLSLQSWALVERDVSEGILTVVEREDDNDLAYYLLMASSRKEAILFADWLQNGEALNVEDRPISQG
ncbi:MAG: LysR substrate-binding domain-containing protein [Pseudomonadota bacterium]